MHKIKENCTQMTFQVLTGLILQRSVNFGEEVEPTLHPEFLPLSLEALTLLSPSVNRISPKRPCVESEQPC